MLDAKTSPENDSLDPREARAARRLATLERLAEIGMKLAELLERRVDAAVEAVEETDAPPFDRGAAALAVRAKAERTAAREAAARARAARIKEVTDCAEEAVVQVIETLPADDLDEERAERLYEALSERLEDPREADEIADAPVSAVVARLCAALGVTPDWSLWEREDWAVAEWKAGTPGSPYAPGTSSEGPSTTSPGPPSAAAVRRGDRQIVGDRMDRAESAVPLLTPSPTRWGRPSAIDSPPPGELSRSDGGGFERAHSVDRRERGPPDG